MSNILLYRLTFLFFIMAATYMSFIGADKTIETSILAWIFAILAKLEEK